jgi:hypothetical protein
MLGEYYIIDSKLNSIIATHVDVEVPAKELGVIAAWESRVD